MADKKKWIKAATDNSHGQFKAKAENAGKSTAAYAREHEGDTGKLGKEARLAETLMSMHRSHNKNMASTKNIMHSMYKNKE